MSCGAIGGWRASCAQDSGDWIERMSSVVDVLRAVAVLVLHGEEIIRPTPPRAVGGHAAL